ncbi:MAG: hypothetical protein AAF611_19420 [Bacteroidota bacterium]
MKEQKQILKGTLAVILFIASIVSTIIFIGITINEFHTLKNLAVLLPFSTILLVASVGYYVILTNFGRQENKELTKIVNEKKKLQEMIEIAELKKKLKEIEQK